MIKIAIVEDELDMANDLIRYTKDFFNKNEIEVNLTHFDNALKLLDNYNYDFDLIFMDINLPKTNGMVAAETIRKIDPLVMIIFVTSLAQYALKGYEVNAFDFIVKPVSYYGFCLKLNRVLIRFNNNKDKILWINVSGVGKRKINISDLKYVEVIKHNIIYHTLHGDFQTRDTMQNVIENINDSRFVLCNRCYLVNLKFVSEIRQWSAIVGGDELQMSHLKKKEFVNEVNRYLSLRGNNS